VCRSSSVSKLSDVAPRECACCGKKVVDDAALGLLQIADRFAEQGGGLQQKALAAVVGFAKQVAAQRCWRDVADGQAFEGHEAFLVTEQPEIDDLADLLMLQRALLYRIGQERLVVFVLHGILS